MVIDLVENVALYLVDKNYDNLNFHISQRDHHYHMTPSNERKRGHYLERMRGNRANMQTATIQKQFKL